MRSRYSSCTHVEFEFFLFIDIFGSTLIYVIIVY